MYWRGLYGRNSPTGLPLRVTMKSSPSSSALMISPLLLRSSRWVSFFVIEIIVAPVLQSIFVFQERVGQPKGQAPRSLRRQNAEQGAASGDPPKRLLEHPRAQAPADQIANRESG